MKQTLLEMVQRILESRDAQVVNRIEDTREAMQVANIIKETYYHLLYVRDIKSRTNLITFDSLSDREKPTYLRFKDDVAQIDMLKYFDKKHEKYIDLTMVGPQEFIERSLMMNPKEDNVTTCQDFSGVKFNVYNDRAPTIWTSFDDEHIVVDGFNKEIEDTVTATNVMSYGVKYPEFKLEDTFVPDLAPQHFTLLLSKSKVMAAMELDKEYDQLEDDRARKQLMTVNDHSKRLLGQEATLWKNRNRSGRRIK
jgi:hypothetical protein